MGTPHKHAALIKAWADGAAIEFRSSEMLSKENQMNHRANPKAPHNQPFHLAKRGSNKAAWWNPLSPTYYLKRKQKDGAA